VRNITNNIKGGVIYTRESVSTIENTDFSHIVASTSTEEEDAEGGLVYSEPYKQYELSKIENEMKFTLTECTF